MTKQLHFLILFALLSMFTFEACAEVPNGYDDLIKLFEEFREFYRPKQIDGVPDYTVAAMADQYKQVRGYQQRLEAIDIADWPVDKQVEYHIVRAEMNGLEFEHRVRKPWRRDPSFYIFTAAGAGPTADGSVDMPQLPMSKKDAERVKDQLQAVTGLLKQARGNLSEAVGDLARFTLHFLGEEIEMYQGMKDEVSEHHPELVPEVEKVISAVKDYGEWLEANLSDMPVHAGIGKENYNWWLKNVHLIPYTWDEIYASLSREYEFAIGALQIVEHRNRNLPPFELVSSSEEYMRRWRNDEQYMFDFMKKNELLTLPDYYEEYNPGEWWNSREKHGVQDFFEQCRDRDMLAEVAHNTLGHHTDELVLSRDNRPIRGKRRLYDIDMIRNEGLAFGLEEIFLQSDVYRERPRAEEVNLIAKAFRAVRGLADLKIHSKEFTLADALDYCYEETPYHWMIKGGHEVWFEMQTTVRAPGWHMGMVLGKLQMMNLIGDAGTVHGDDFKLGKLIDDFRNAGTVPISLIRWEMTGLTDEIEKLW